MEKPKPDPGPYLQAMAKLGLEAKDCIVFEDSHVGTEAATKAGANIVKALWYPSIFQNSYLPMNAQRAIWTKPHAL